LNMVPGGTVTLHGTNTYTGPTTVFPGALIVKKAAGLYNGDTAKWTPTNITVHKAATLRLSVGGPGEFTGAHVGTLLANLTTGVSSNGLMAGSVLYMDTANATDPVVLTGNIADSKGPGGGAFLIKKCGAGTLRLAGNNTYTGQTVLEGGTLSVSSLNSVVKGKASSSLGAPTDVENGEIVIGGGDGEFTLIYTGTGETSDRVMNLAGKTSTVAFDQSGTGLLKLTSTFVISGYGASKTIILTGSTAGTGEIAGNILNPHDRAGKATTAVTKSGTGTWTLSGTNIYTGPTKVTGGVLACSNASSLGGGILDISTGAKLQLNYVGTRQVAALTFNGGSVLPNGTYGSTASPATNKDDTHFSGIGTVTVVTPGVS
ncbi:MAG: autotransporter-associated beta strand repeat-containing protein, partial [Planctomycetota bacterium]|nr:autotransporter-associated beta strand repeat-containing protein [Planctomycetota bacterium]